MTAATRITLIAAITCAALAAQTQGLSFEVASIKPVQDCRMPGPAQPVPGEFVLPCASVVGFIQTAYVTYADGMRYETESVPMDGLPDWARKEMYTLRAKAEGNPTQATMGGPMLRSLLEERFHLEIHEETREIPVYQMTVTRGATKLVPHVAGSCLPWAPGTPLPQGQRFCETRLSQRSPNVFTLHLEGVDLNTLAKRLGTMLDRPVVDRSGLPDLFDVKLDFAPDDQTPTLLRSGQPSEPSTAAGLSTAMQEQFGLRLERTKGPGRFLVIDHVERPTEN